MFDGILYCPDFGPNLTCPVIARMVRGNSVGNPVESDALLNPWHAIGPLKAA
jgi:hypothetical protein